MYRLLNIVRGIKSRRFRWTGHVARMEEGGSAFKIVTGRSIGKGSLGRLRLRRDYNIRLDLGEVGVNVRNWVDLT